MSSEAKNVIPIYIIDDDRAVRDSLAALLEVEGFMARTFSSAHGFLDTWSAPEAFGCALIDVRMPGMDGLELLERLMTRKANLAVIVMTGHADVPMAVRAMKAGARDFLEKPVRPDVLIESIKRIVDQDEAQQAGFAREAVAATRLGNLTGREREVLDHLLHGRSNKLIARELGISPRTVEVHRARVMEKMEAKSLSDLVRLAIGAGIFQ